MNKKPLLVIFSFLLLAALVFAKSFDTSVTPTTVDAGLSNKFLNFTVSYYGSENLTQVNITLPSGFNFVNVSNFTFNGTTATNANFSSSSNTLIWSNTTPLGFNPNASFWFNVSIPKNIGGIYNFNISIQNITGFSNTTNSTNASIFIERTAWSSPIEQFYIKPIEIYLNWTNSYKANISLIPNTSWTSALWEGIQVSNVTSILAQNYSQDNSQTICQQIPLQLQNISGYGNIFGPLNATNITNATLVNTHLECRPGRYYTGSFSIANATRTNETASITVFLDIPISATNRISNSTGMGDFRGTLPANTTTYHSFFFNATSSTTSEIQNATGIFINLTPSSDMDMFLFDDSGNLKAKSINKTANVESLQYNYLPSAPAMWEIRIYGNATSAITYNGNIFFTTLNATDSSTNQTISLINFGTTNATSNITKYITLRNEGNLNFSNVTESKEFYYVKRFNDTNSKNFTIFVPDSSIVRKIKISLNWTGATNYSFYLYDQNGTLIANSSNKYVYANKSGAMQEEYDETTSISSVSAFWRILVTNTTMNVTDIYTLTAYLYVDASRWIATNYTEMMFNRSGFTNSSFNLHMNLTVPTSVMNGTYEGYIQYLDANKAGIKIPIRVDITTPTLVVNNSMNSEIYRLDENYGFNLARTLNFRVNNTGNYNMFINFTDSNGTLNCYSGSCTGYNATFTYNSTNFIPANSFTDINVIMTFNRSLPAATYSGWIIINATNTTDPNMTAHPYSAFTINLRLNLTDLLDVRILRFITSDNNQMIENSSASENITIAVDVYYLNGTGPITDILNLTNFTSIWLQERNVTDSNGRTPSTGSMTLYNGTNPIRFACPAVGSTSYCINATVPANRPGGLYNVYVTAVYTYNNTQPRTYTGTGSNGTLSVNNTGLYMKYLTSSNSLSITNTSIDYFVVNVSNFGNLTASGYIMFSASSCSGYTVEYYNTSSTTWCPRYSGANFTINLPGNYTNCTVGWKITGGTSTAAACISNIIGSPSTQWFNPNGINVTVTVTGGGGTSSSTSGSSTTPTTIPVTYAANLAFTKADSLITVQQNSSNSTEVGINNTGNVNQNITFTIDSINSSWYSLNATNVYLVVGKNGGFRATFSVGNVDVKDYSGKFKASSPNKTITSDFTLRVTPAPTKKTEINETLTSYKLNATKLEQEINQSKKQGLNTTAAEKKFAELKSKIQQAEDYIKVGDYNSAYYLFDTIKKLFDETKDELSKAKKTGGWRLFTLPEGVTGYILIGGGIAGTGFLVYLFWPTRVVPTKTVYAAIKPGETKVVKKSILLKLKEKLSEIFSKIFKREEAKPAYAFRESPET